MGGDISWYLEAGDLLYEGDLQKFALEVPADAHMSYNFSIDTTFSHDSTGLGDSVGVALYNASWVDPTGEFYVGQDLAFTQSFSSGGSTHSDFGNIIRVPAPGSLVLAILGLVGVGVYSPLRRKSGDLVVSS